MILPGAFVLAAGVATTDAATSVQAPPTRSPTEMQELTVFPPDEAPRRPLRWFILEVGGGAYYQQIFAVQAYGGGGFLRVGSSSEATDWTLGLEYARGQTFHGLDVVTWRLGWVWDWHYDRLRIGLGPTLGNMHVDRATDDNYMLQLFVGLDVHASFDILRVQSRSAFFVRASFKVDAAVLAPTLWLGFRFAPEVTASSSPSAAEPTASASPPRQRWTLPPPGKR